MLSLCGVECHGSSVHKPTVNLGGGILIGCKAEFVLVRDVSTGQFSVVLRCLWKEDSFEWMFIGVYGPQDAASHDRTSFQQY